MIPDALEEVNVGTPISPMFTFVPPLRHSSKGILNTGPSFSAKSIPKKRKPCPNCERVQSLMTWLASSQKIRHDKVRGSYCGGPRFLHHHHHHLTSGWYHGTGGSLGWKVRGSLHGDYEKVAYELEPSTTAHPKCEFLYFPLHTYNKTKTVVRIDTLQFHHLHQNKWPINVGPVCEKKGKKNQGCNNLAHLATSDRIHQLLIMHVSNRR